MVDAIRDVYKLPVNPSQHNIFHLLLANAANFPQKEAMVIGGDRLTYLQLLERVRAVAKQLASAGLKKGDRVGLLFPNHPDYVASFFAVLALGATIVPINPLLKSQEIAHILSDCGATTLIVHSHSLPEALKSQKLNQQLKTIFVSPEYSDSEDIDTKILPLTQEFLNEATAFWQANTSEEDIALIVYTSGTTGKPKGAVLSHRNLLSIFPARLDMFDINESDRTLAVLPMCHIYGITILMIGTIARAATLVLVPKFEASTTLDTIARERITILPAVPAMYQFMLMESQKKSYDFSAVRLCFCGGASMPPALIDKVESLFSAVLIEGYAMTETSCVATINPYHGTRKTGSVGPPVPGLSIKVVDKEGRELPPGPAGVGELWIKGPNVMRGYYKQEEASAEALKDGWFNTGDLGYKDEDSYFYIVGRKKELIIRGGQNIYPREIEEVLASMKGIAEAAVIGIPDEFMGERVKAVVVPNGSCELTADAVKAFCAEQLAEYKVPRIIEFSEALPRNSTGKVLKRLLS